MKESLHKEEGGAIVLEEREIDEPKYANNKEAADSCPVNVIHVYDKDGKKII